MSALPGWLGTVAVIAGALGVFFAAFTSKYQRKLTADRERYIAHLEEKSERQAEENRTRAEKLARLEERVSVLEDLLLGKCEHFSIDENGACRHCTRRLRYGQKSKEGTP